MQTDYPTHALTHTHTHTHTYKHMLEAKRIQSERARVVGPYTRYSAYLAFFFIFLRIFAHFSKKLRQQSAFSRAM